VSRPAVPAGIEPLVAGYESVRDTVGESGAAVYRLRRPGADDRYLKLGHGAVAREIADEVARLRWLAGQMPVPDVIEFVATDDAAWLLMTALPGRTAAESLRDPASDRIAIVDALATALRRWHGLPIESCPFNADIGVRMLAARARLAAGLVDPRDWGAARAGSSVEQAWDELRGFLPITPDPVVTHGDLTLDNVLIEGEQVVGCVDVGRAGVADRYQDLALLWAGLAEFGDALPQRFLASYGATTPDMHKIRFHLALDEWF
jgi:aminoglycoside 3'-phosphotransferase-1